MVITLEEIFRDVVGTFPGQVDHSDAYPIITWINEAYVEIRNAYIKGGRHVQFCIEDYLGDFANSQSIPYMLRASLGRPMLEMAEDMAVVNLICRLHPELTQEAVAWNNGDKAWQGSNLFKAVSDVPATNSAGLTYEKGQVRNYYPANGLKYGPADVVFEDGIPYRPIANTVIASSSDPLADNPEWQRLYWERVGIGFTQPEVVALDKIDRKKASIDAGAVVVSFDRDGIYCSKNVESLYIQYVPEHNYIRDFEKEFVAPDNVLTAWRQGVHQRMAASMTQPTDNE